MSKRRNPINDVGVIEVYGIDEPQAYQTDGFTFVKEHTMIPQKYVDELKGFERFIFAKLYAGSFSKNCIAYLNTKRNKCKFIIG